MKKIISTLFTTLFFSTLFISCDTASKSSSDNENFKYQCPMKCEGEKIYDKAGTCPVCKMDLKKIEVKSKSETINSEKYSPIIIGKMKNVMWKGQLYGNIDLDTITYKQHLYGLGPVEYLTGEIMVFDGKAYKSSVVTETTMKVEETYQAKAPFFGFANIDSWIEIVIPENITTIKDLETYLNSSTKDYPRPYFFKLSVTAENATIHIVNLPKGSKVSSPDEAHKGQTNYKLENQQVDILGFFSTEHKAIFTHHDTYLHMHLLTTDKTKMGHLDELKIKKGSAKLYLPNNGGKWKVDASMITHIRNMENDIISFSNVEQKDFKSLAEKLQSNIDLLTSNCTMKGTAHNELHKWLLPYIDIVEELLKAKDETEAAKQFKNIQTSFTTFNQYFQ